MKKVLAIVLAALLIVAALAGCAAKSKTADTTATTDTAAAETTDGKLEVLKVGASSTPHAEILEQVKDTLAAEGYDLQIVVYDDYVLPNQSLADGSLDANYFQHTPYLNSFNAANGTDLFESDGKFDTFSTVACLYAETCQIIASADSGIKTVADLKGKTVYAIQKKLINGGQLCFHRRGNLLDQDAAAISGKLFGLFLDTI
mgnify:CR=1 FL=1